MPAEILHESSPGLFMVRLEDGRTVEMPLDMAQEQVAKSYPVGSDQNPMQMTPEHLNSPGPVGTDANPMQMTPMHLGAEPNQASYAVAPQEPPPAEITMPPDPVNAPAPTQAQATGFGPVANAQVTPNGYYGAPRDGGARLHQGVDYAAEAGDPVTAMLPGRVVRVGQTVGDGGRGGNRVQIDHGNGITSSMMHLSGFNAKEGDEVAPGAVVGFAGNTGTSSSGPHVHTKLEVDGKPVSPEEWSKAVKERLGAEISPATATQIQTGQASQGALLGSSASGSFSGQSGATAPITSPSQINTGLPGVPSPDGYLAGVANVQEMRAKAAGMELQGLLGQQAVQSQLAADTAALYAKEAQAKAQAQARADQERAQYEANIQQAMAQVAKVDPGRVWKNAGTLGSAMGLFSAAVGGWLQVLQGGPNHALNAIMQMIQQDIQAQETDIATQREGVFRAERAYERGENRIQDQFRRMEEGKMVRLQGLMEKAKAEMMLFESPIARANYAKTIAALEGEYLTAFKNASDETWKRSFDTAVSAQRMAEAQEQLRQGREQLSIAWSNSETARNKAMAGEGNATAKRFRDPTTRQVIYFDPNTVVNEAELSKAQIRLGTRRDIGEAAKTYLEVLQRVGRRYQGWGSNNRAIGDKDVKLLKAAHKDVVSRLIKARSGAAFTAEELKTYEEMIGQPPGLTGLDPTQNVKLFLQKLGTEENHELNGVGAINEDSTPFDAYQFYLDIPDVRPAESVDLNEMRDVVLRGDDPGQLRGAIHAFTDLMDYPGQQEGFHQNFPNLKDEVEGSVLRLMAEAKEKGDLRTVTSLKQSYEEFLGAWMQRARTRGATPNKPREEIYGDSVRDYQLSNDYMDMW